MSFLDPYYRSYRINESFNYYTGEIKYYVQRRTWLFWFRVTANNNHPCEYVSTKYYDTHTMAEIAVKVFLLKDKRKRLHRKWKGSTIPPSAADEINQTIAELEKVLQTEK